MPTCSHCHTEITHTYCPQCGQKYVKKRVSFQSVIKDLITGFVSLDKSVWSNMKIGLRDPAHLVQNYWKGFRKFYFSPNKFLILALFFMGINFLITQNEFLSIRASGNGVKAQFVLFFLIIPILSLFSFTIYWKWRKNFAEHLVLIYYTLSIWTIIFSVISILLFLLEAPDIAKRISTFLFFSLIFYWNARILVPERRKRIAYFLINTVSFFLIIDGLVYLFMT